MNSVFLIINAVRARVGNACLTRLDAFVTLGVAAVQRCSLAGPSCRSGGIGRRAWFRSMYPQGCGGSSPFFGTKFSAKYLASR
jgi:hypothetical protein